MSLLRSLRLAATFALLIATFPAVACGIGPSAERQSEGDASIARTTTTASSPEHDTYLIERELTGGEEIAFPRQKYVEEGLYASIGSTGELYLRDGCIRFRGLRGGYDVLPVWPPGYSLSVEGGVIQILDEDGEVFARVGDRVELSGSSKESLDGLISISGQLRRELPERCVGRYQIVGPLERVESTVGADSQYANDAAVGGNTAQEPTMAEDSMPEEVSWYAEEQGVSFEEAVRRFELMEAGDDLTSELFANERETFAGIWVQHQPEFRIKTRFAEGGEQTVRRYIEGGSLEGLVDVLPAEATYDELVEAEAEARRIVDGLGVPAESGVDESENVAFLNVIDRERLEEVLRESGEELPDHVRIVEVEVLGGPV